MSDFPSNRAGMNPATQAFAITPNDDNDLARPARSLHIGGAGTISVIPADGSAAVALTVGQGILPLAVKRVRATGTTATAIVGLL